MTARTDRFDLGRYFPAYATGRELEMGAARQGCEHFSSMRPAMEVESLENKKENDDE